MSREDKPKVSYPISVLTWLSNEALNDIIRSGIYDDETKRLATHVLVSRDC